MRPKPIEPDRLDPAAPGRAPLLLQAVAASVFVFPASMVIGPLGAVGTVPIMLGLLCFVLWAMSVLLGMHDSVSRRHPGRVALAALLIASLLSYAAMYAGWTAGSTVATRASADRWVVLMIASAGIALCVTDALRTLSDVLVLVRALLAGALFCSVVALMQFYFRVNPVTWIQQVMPGFTYNGGDTPFQNRGSFVRVAGTTFHSIELAAVFTMLLPLSIWRALYDPLGRKWVHWLGTLLLVFGVAATVSRTGVLGLTVGLVVFLPFLPRTARRWAALTVPVGVVALFMTVPGILRTLGGALGAVDQDPSISTRTNNYPRVEDMLSQHPWWGAGPGNYVPETALQILDNQYLGSAVTLGVVGLVAVTAYFALPAVEALVAARAATTPALRVLAAAVAAGCLAGAVCSATFDSLSFPVFALVYPLLLGLAGAVWILTKHERWPGVGDPWDVAQGDVGRPRTQVRR